MVCNLVGLYLTVGLYQSARTSKHYPAEQVHGWGVKESASQALVAEVFEVFAPFGALRAMRLLGLKGTYQWGERLFVLSTLVNIFAPSRWVWLTVPCQVRRGKMGEDRGRIVGARWGALGDIGERGNIGEWGEWVFKEGGGGRLCERMHGAMRACAQEYEKRRIDACWERERERSNTAAAYPSLPHHPKI